MVGKEEAVARRSSSVLAKHSRCWCKRVAWLAVLALATSKRLRSWSRFSLRLPNSRRSSFTRNSCDARRSHCSWRFLPFSMASSIDCLKAALCACRDFKRLNCVDISSPAAHISDALIFLILSVPRRKTVGLTGGAVLRFAGSANHSLSKSFSSGTQIGGASLNMPRSSLSPNGSSPPSSTVYLQQIFSSAACTARSSHEERWRP
mmetsp:Transcript_97579/g.153758  ORF Transcript_97579/g.153758 Transcript_97579/m.153758 type:complete len:205 (-) Transcript_97579:7-621(-)